MGGISGGSSKSSSKPKLTQEQKATYRYIFADVMPQARGQDTFLSQMLEQNARDEADALQNQQIQQAQTGLAAAGGGSAQMASLLKNLQDQALQQTFKRITEQKQAVAMNALQMIGNLPLSPGQESKSRSISGGVSVGGGATS